MSRRKQTRARNETKPDSGFKPTKTVPRSDRQRQYMKAIATHDVTFAYGPAGTGKTRLAIALAVQALRKEAVGKIVLTRPAVDSGTSIGFLPGTMEEKMGPFLIPLFDELSYYLERKTILAFLENKTIEIVPLNMMRGRTFVNTFVILDEAQNATMAELRMCLTRIGMHSKMVIAGDIFQSDLPPHQRGGLRDCLTALDDIEGVAQCELTSDDIVRHHLIAEIERRLRAV